jgi:hypothetical protein
MNLEHRRHVIYEETLFYTLYMSSFSQKYCTGKPVVRV